MDVLRLDEEDLSADLGPPTCRGPAGTTANLPPPEELRDEELPPPEEVSDEEQETEEEQEPIVRPRRRRTGFRAKLTHMASRHEARDMETLWRRYCTERGSVGASSPSDESGGSPRKNPLPPVKMGNANARAFRRAAQQHFIVGCWMLPSGILEGRLLAWLRGSTPVRTAGANPGKQGISTTAPPAAPQQSSRSSTQAQHATVVDAAGTPFAGFDNAPVLLTLLACVFYIHMRALTTTYVSALAVSVGQTVANVPFFALSALILDGVFAVSPSPSEGATRSRARGLQFLALVGVLAAAMGYAFTDRPETAAREAGRFRRVVGRLPWSLSGELIWRRRSGTRGQSGRTAAGRGASSSGGG